MWLQERRQLKSKKVPREDVNSDKLKPCLAAGLAELSNTTFQEDEGGILEQIKEVRLMLVAEDKKMLGDEENSVPAGTLEGRIA